jgi:predicted RNase H-like HicB family nuclease
MWLKHRIVFEREGGAGYGRGARAAAKKGARRQPVRAGAHAYAAVFERAPEGGYVVHFPAFGITTQGETLAEARAMARDLLEGHIDWLLRDGGQSGSVSGFLGTPSPRLIRL